MSSHLYGNVKPRGLMRTQPKKVGPELDTGPVDKGEALQIALEKKRENMTRNSRARANMISGSKSEIP